MGDVYLKLGDRQKALEFYRRSLEHREKDREPMEQKIRNLTGGDS
jgi:predicted negative regulator of RcsB-dependent stress response